MNILGIVFYNEHYGCVGSALLQDGRLVAAAEEERFNRKHFYGGFPRMSIEYCLKAGGIAISDVDWVCTYLSPLSFLHKRMWHLVKHLPGSLGVYRTHSDDFWKQLAIRKSLERELGIPVQRQKFRILRVLHHKAHAASAFFVSPFERAAIMTLDGSGEWATATAGLGEGNSFKFLAEMPYPHSFGHLYAAVSDYLGFPPPRGPGKVMGLSSYGTDEYSEEFEDLVRYDGKFGFRLNLGYFAFHRNAASPSNSIPWVSNKFLRRFGPPRSPEEPINRRHENIAAALQHLLNKHAIQKANFLHRTTGAANLCLAGGVALNSVMNGEILRNTPYERIFIQPAAGDAGTALGAALFCHHCIQGNKRSIEMTDAYLGPGFTREELRKALQSRRVAFEEVPDIERRVAAEIARGKVVGWFQGRMEYGPRALGNRSILADPRNPEMKDILNRRVKHREPFRPFAPSVLEEETGKFFVDDIKAPFMLFVTRTLPEKSSVLPAITHVDGTARIQTVAKDANPRYWKLIDEFRRLTGVPVVVNTSFNIKGEPIVCTPEDAVNCFVSTGIDVLALGDFLASKQCQHE